MKLFEFFKKKSEEPVIFEKEINGNPIDKKEVDRLVAAALDILSDGKGTMDDAKKFLLIQGCDEKVATQLALRANNVYVKYYLGHSS